MVGARPHHRAQGFAVIRMPFRAGEGPRALSPAEVLLPNQQPKFIAQVEETLVLRIVRTTHKITAEILQQSYIGEHLQRRGRRPAARMPLVAVVAFEEDLFAVQPDRAAARLDVFEVTLGVVGPAALGREVQNGFHDLIDVDHANGWANQIHDEPGVNLVYERKYRWATADARTGWGADFIPHAGASLGNIFTYANAGFEVRAGYALPADFGSNLIRPSGDSNALKRAPFNLFLFAATDGRAVARDITLDGNTFRDSPSIGKKTFVADFYAGLGIGTTRWQLTYAQNYRTLEFDGQDKRSVFGSISLSFFY